MKLFDREVFLADIMEEMKYLGIRGTDLAVLAKIPQKRFTCLINNKAKFKKEDIEAIEKALGMN